MKTGQRITAGAELVAPVVAEPEAPPRQRLRRGWLRRLAPGAWAGLGAAGLSLAFAVWALRLWRADLNVPLRYSAGDDTLYYLSLIKGIIDHGWWFTNHSLGAPFGQQLFDFPNSGNDLNLFAIKLLAFPLGSAARVLNVFYLLTFPLDALAAFWVLRKLGSSAVVAMVCSVLFALLPYHFFRGDSHVFLSAYYALPLAAYLFMSILRAEPLFERRGPPAGRRSGWLSFRSVQTVLICVVVAMGDLYYATFALVLVLAGIVLGAFGRRPRRVLVGGAAAWALIGALVVVNLVPTIVYELRHGSNPVVTRSPSTGDGLALSVSYLVLPNRDDRIAPLRNITRHYESTTPRQAYCETCHEAMGTVADVGFFWLAIVGLGSLIAVPAVLRLRSTYRYAAAGAAVCLAVGVSGGLSSLIRAFVTADIRGWNRISVLIAFFSLLASAQLLDALGHRWRGRWRPLGLGLVLAGVTVFGVFDQTNPGALVPYATDQALYASDRAFFADVQSVLPHGARVFELPYVPFPEGYQPVTSAQGVVPGVPGFSAEYDLARGFLNTHGLSWSYGAMKGRPADWQSQLAAKPINLALAGAAASGFQGLVVDLTGYPNAVPLQRELQQLLGGFASMSPQGDFLFYDLRPFAHHLQATRSAAQLAALKAAVLHPLRLSCAAGSLTVDNPGPSSRHAVLSASASATVTVNGVPQAPRAGRIRVPLQVAPGITRLALGGPSGSELVGPTLVDAAFAPFTGGPGSAILSGVVGPPCLDVPTQASAIPTQPQSPFPT